MMQRLGIIIWIFFLQLAVLQPSYAQQYELVWSDEFNDDTLDTNVWNYETGNGCPENCGWGTGQDDYATSREKNVRVDSGNLILELHNDPYNGYDYTSGRLTTQDNFSVQYGRVESRLKIPEGQGIGAAFWMLMQYAPYGAWPQSGEIDIMETNGNEQYRNNGTVHYQEFGYHQYDHEDIYTSTNIHEQYHTYAIEWDKDAIKWFVDGQQYHEFDISGNIEGRRPFDGHFYIIMSVGVGSQVSGDTIDESAFPTRLYADYIRVYKDKVFDSCDQKPFPAMHHIPGQVEAEHYDQHCELKLPEDDLWRAYYDNNYGNIGGLVYRHDAVDMQVTEDSVGDYNVGWIEQWEWLEYTIYVDSAGTYDMSFRLATPNANKAFDVLVDGSNVGTVAVPQGNDWQDWKNTTLSGVTLDTGKHVLRLNFTTGEFNFNYFTIGAEYQEGGQQQTGVLTAERVDAPWNVYPNPVQDHIWITAEKNRTYQDLSTVLYNMQGQKVAEYGAAKLPLKCNVTELPDGPYMLRIQSATKSSIHRIIKR